MLPVAEAEALHALAVVEIRVVFEERHGLARVGVGQRENEALSKENVQATTEALFARHHRSRVGACFVAGSNLSVMLRSEIRQQASEQKTP